MTKIRRDIIEIDEALCTGCGQCILDCAEGAIAIVDGKARVIADKLCDGLGACIGGCPTDALKIVQRETDAYDEAAVEAHLAGRRNGATHAAPGCPSLLPLAPSAPRGCASEGAGHAAWPLKLFLMPPDAPFLRGAHLMIAADCSAFAAASFHSGIRTNQVLLIACPKLEGAESIKTRLAALFAASRPASVTVVRMEVPCCRVLAAACAEAAQANALPMREIVLTRNGEQAG